METSCQSPYQFFEVSRAAGVTVVSFSDAVALSSFAGDDLQRELRDFFDRVRPLKLLFDLGDLRHCSTAAINALLIVRRKLRAVGGALRLCGLGVYVREKFRALNLEGTVFDIYDSRTAALADF